MKKIFVLFLLLFLTSSQGWSAVKTQVVNYQYGGTTMKGYLAWDDAVSGKRPGILVVHEFWGLNDYARQRAEQLAKMGYVALAADMYGDGKSSMHPEEAQSMMQEVRSNIKTWVGRATAALQVLKDNPNVDPQKLAAIGYCFGGATALQLAYSGADLKAAVSFHGSLPIPDSTQAIKARLLIMQGADDPFVPADVIQKLKDTLAQGKVSYRFISYPGAGHSFTVPDAEMKMKMKGVAYNAEADKLSWQEMTKLFQEVFKAGK
ncbi:MAG: dienelactone hydrolase family protein [bacterium]